MAIALYDLTHTLARDLTAPADAARAWDEAHAVATLQGIVNRDAPRLYLRYVEHDGANVDDYWLAQLTAKGAWLAGASIQRVPTLEELVTRFRDDIAGAVVYDASLPALSNLASTIAGVQNLIAIREDATPGSLFDRLVTNGLKLPIVQRICATDFPAGEAQSAKCAAYHWAVERFIETGLCDPHYLGYYIDAWWINHAHHCVPNHHTLTNHDYFVAKRAFFCDLNCWPDETAVDDPHQPVGADLRALQEILHALYVRRGGKGMLHVGGFIPWAFKYTDLPQAGGIHDGVQSEWELVRIISAYDGFLDADAIGHGAMANASFYMHFPLEERYPQRLPTSDEDCGTGFPTGHDRQESRSHKSTDDDRDWIVFYVGDYDAAAWIYQRMPDLWEDKRRGEVPLTWSLNPVLCRRAPMVMDHMRRTRTPNDFFMAGDNGAGYLNPAMLIEPRPESNLPSGLANWRDHCTAYYQQWDLRITGFIIDGRATQTPSAALDAYAKFSPDGVVMQYDDVDMRMHGEMPVLRRGPDIGGDVGATVERILADIAERRTRGVRFHWYRSILQSPAWHADITHALAQRDARIQVVGAPEFFARLKHHLSQ
ncbi:MAG: hypothetical protein H6817_08410 [Phycisphaerales bacterium]|nr:hypothetical protein [Phycisphaerales bacterium]